MAAVLVAAGGAATAAPAFQPPGSVPAVGSECGAGVSGEGFRVYACESGGAERGHGHPKELLVVRADRSSVAYPAFRIGGLAVGDGEVVSVHNLNLVRVTSRRLVSLLTSGELAGALHIRPAAIMDVDVLGVDRRGNVDFAASVLRGGRAGCRNPILERTAGGALLQIRSLRTSICR